MPTPLVVSTPRPRYRIGRRSDEAASREPASAVWSGGPCPPAGLGRTDNGGRRPPGGRTAAAPRPRVRILSGAPNPLLRESEKVRIVPHEHGRARPHVSEPFRAGFALSDAICGRARGRTIRYQVREKRNRTVGRLTAKMVKALERPGRYGDGGRCTSSSRLGQQELGAAADDRRQAARSRPGRISARDARRGARAGVRQPPAGAPGPRPARRQAACPDAFEQAAGRALRANRARWRNAKTATNWTESMTKHAFPVFGARRVYQIGR